MSRRTDLDLRATTLMVLLCGSWGLQQVAIKVAIVGVSPVAQAGLRSAGAVVLVWLWARLRAIPLFERDGTLPAGMLAGAMFAAEFALIYWGLEYTSASRGVVFLYTTPFIVALGAHLLLPGERLRRWQWAGLACAFAGIVLAFGESLTLPKGEEWIGDAMFLGAALLWGATTLVIRTSKLAEARATKTLFYQLAVSAVTLPFAAMALGEPGIVQVTPLVLASLAYQAVLVAFASYLAWFWLIAHYPAAQLAAFSFLTPVFGVFAGVVLLGERLTPALLGALVLVAIGIRLVNRPPRRAPVNPRNAAGTG